MRRRLFVRCLAATFIFVALAVHGQGWKPERAVEIIVGSTPGGALDRTGRLLARIIQERKLVEQPAAVLNKPGGTGAVGLAHLAQYPGDGHRAMVIGQALLTNHIMGRSALNYTDFTPLAILNVEY